MRQKNTESQIQKTTTMKKNRIVAVVFSLVVGFAVGLLVGLTLTNPGMSLREAAGTIGRVDQYRNIRVTEADIELRNELLADEMMREAYRNYLAYEYASNIKMSEDVDFALRAGRDNSEFRVAHAGALNRLEQYGEFLDNARLRILEAMGVVTDLSDRDRIAIRTVLNNAGNALAQTQLRGNVVFDYLMAVERFFDTHPKSYAPRLATAHDLLFTNMLMNTIVNDNRPVLEYLMAKDLMTDGDDDLVAVFDAEKLNRQVLLDVELLDAGRLGAFKNEASLQFLIRDVTLIGSAIRDFSALDASNRIQDMQKLDDLEVLGTTFPFDMEQLESVMRSTEMLRESDMMMDAGALRGIISF